MLFCTRIEFLGGSSDAGNVFVVVSLSLITDKLWVPTEDKLFTNRPVELREIL